MRSDIESLWVLGVASKCIAFTEQNIGYSLLLIALPCLSLAFLFWLHPGGPAWGRQLFPSPNPIPGPRGLPVIGSMGLMTGLAHRKIAAQAQACSAKRLMAFSLGDTRVIVTCHPDVARDILNSSVFADRPLKESAYSLMFNRAIGFAPYGVYWRTLRRIAATHLFSPKQIKASEPQRQDIAAQMLRLLHRRQGPHGFPIRQVLKRASLNNMMCSVFGQLYGLDSCTPQVEQLKCLVDQGYDLLGTLNWSDHLTCLAHLDPQKIRLRCAQLVPKVNRFVAQIIADHRITQTGDRNRDFVDVLLSLQVPDKLSDSDMIAVLWEMIFRGTDTVAVLMEWILARMVMHRDVQSRVHEELDKVVGRTRGVAESDVEGMTYLQAVVKEVLRVHPPGPLLSWARLAITDTTIDGYSVPKGTTAMVNMWAISRDPQVWPNPDQFMPERFVAKENESEFSVFGSDLRLAPFGSGRRTCPGKALGLTTVTFWVASLLHEYEWFSNDAVDLSEVLKLSCEMANPLMVQFTPRRSSS